MEVPTNDIKSILDQFGVGVESECGKLDIVVMHRPGRELLRLNNNNLHHLLYDALPDIHQTHRSHDKFAQYLREHGTQILYLADLLRETLVASVEARDKLVNAIIAHSHLDDDQEHRFAVGVLRKWLRDRSPKQLAEDVIVGVACVKEELGPSEHAQTLLKIEHFRHRYVIEPLPNLLFMRDNFSIMEKHVFIWQMNKPARRNEPFVLRIIFEHHPQLSTSGLKIVEWLTRSEKNNNDDEKPTVEGGDVAYLGDGVVMIGCSERTNRAGIEAVARTGLFRQVIAILIPPCRIYMHLDMVLSTVGKHAFVVHGPLAEKMEVFTLKTNAEDKNTPSSMEWVSHGCNVSKALGKLLNDPELIFYGTVDEETSTLEQRHCRHNVVVIDNYHVVTYAGIDAEQGIVSQMTENNMCRVGPIPFEGLREGGGGAHCMTNAIRRRAVK